MEDLILSLLGSINPLWAAVALLVWSIFGTQMSKGAAGVLAWLRSRFVKSPAGPDSPKADPTKSEVDVWLEQHPLLDRLWVKLKEKFKAVPDGKADEDELYKALLDAITDAG